MSKKITTTAITLIMTPFFLVGVILAFQFIVVGIAQADSGGAPFHFGGPVVTVEVCTCQPGVFRIFVGPPGLTLGPPGALTPGYLLYDAAFTFVYEFFQVTRPGAWLLGNFVPPIRQCLIWVGKVCVILPAQGTMQIVGTSL